MLLYRSAVASATVARPCQIASASATRRAVRASAPSCRFVASAPSSATLHSPSLPIHRAPLCSPLAVSARLSSASNDAARLRTAACVRALHSSTPRPRPAEREEEVEVPSRVISRFRRTDRWPMQSFSGMALLFLGTSSALPTRNRNVSSAVLRIGGRAWVFDAGEGTQQQLMRCGCVRSSFIDKFFITHLHGDHVYGLPGMVTMVSHASARSNQSARAERVAPIEIYGPVGIRKLLRTNIQLSQSQIGGRYVVHEFHPPPGIYGVGRPTSGWAAQPLFGDRDYPPQENCFKVYEDETHVVYAAWLNHRVPCVGYVVKEKNMPGRLMVEELDQLGVPPGPVYRVLKEGGSLTLDSGRVLNGSDFVGPQKIGRKVVILGDTCNSDNIIPAAQDADVLVHESTLPIEFTSLAKKFGHSTPHMAGEFATRINARNLILTHFSPRFEDPMNPDEDYGLSEEAQWPSTPELGAMAAECYSGPIITAVDFLGVDIPPRIAGSEVHEPLVLARVRS